MHDPMTKICDINIPFTGKKNSKGGYDKYPTTLLTIWHVDPEKDGTDDSCGWFMRPRHGRKDILESIISRFDFEWQYLFTPESGLPLYSDAAITLHLFRCAAYQHFGQDWRKVACYMQSHLADILSFAENPVDTLHDSIVMRFGFEPKEDRVKHFAHVIYGYILRDTRPWWQHPRWHVHHWWIQIPFVQNLKRFLFSRCNGCGKRFAWGCSVTSTQWDSTGPLWFRSERNVYHGECVPAPQQVSKETK